MTLEQIREETGIPLKMRMGAMSKDPERRLIIVGAHFHPTEPWVLTRLLPNVIGEYPSEYERDKVFVFPATELTYYDANGQIVWAPEVSNDAG